MKYLLIAIVSILSISFCKSQKEDSNRQLIKESITYKEIGNTLLKLHLFTSNKEEKKPVIVFFHPGGWISGSPSFFFEKAKMFSSLGYHTVCVQYRLANLKTTTPKDCLNDSKDALRYLKQNKEKLNLDMSKLFLIGYSAGGHLALMTQLNTDESIPIANRVFTIASPVDLMEDELLKTSVMTTNEKIELSPINHIQNLKTKLYLFNGTTDEYIAYSTISDFSNKAKQLNKNVELTTFKNTGHFLLTTTHKEKIEQKIKQEILKE
ncbi:alpha/beta hydrolase [Maribacter sp.]|uniref:alpha/beta hydrolase n=1 Tax=Maribacter sp. TaxID=1897614 RepID=UPI0025BBC9ED|nr:alpha/beta hydrolase [Maribacter sp.]